MVLEVISVSSKGQIVIPENVRNHLHIKPGSKLVLMEKNGTILLKKEEEVVLLLDEDDQKEMSGWLKLAEQSLKKVWDNPKDEQIWKKYL